MKMTHEEYVEMRNQLECDFNGIYRRIDDCESIVKKEEGKIEKLESSITELKVEQAKTNTRLAILIAILSAIAVPILAVSVSYFFGG